MIIINIPITIDSFRGDFFFLSNFYIKLMTHNGIIYRSVEHFFQSFKTTNLTLRNAIINAIKPGRAKFLGSPRCLVLRPDWHRIRIIIMATGLYIKFSDPELREKLRLTGNAILIEGNRHHDNFWGDCTCQKCKHIKGENHLGRLLMAIRSALTILYGKGGD